MIQIVLTLIRAFIGVLFAAAAFVFALAGLYFLARQNAHFFGNEGIMFVLGLSIAVGFGVLARKLLVVGFQTQPAA
jgi:hypothetical protein